MDTDDLSIQTYQGVLVVTEQFDHDLTLQFGLLSDDCLKEDEFLQKSIELIKVLKKYSREELSDAFYHRIPDLQSFRMTIKTVSNNIEKIILIPPAGRTFEKQNEK